MHRQATRRRLQDARWALRLRPPAPYAGLSQARTRYFLKLLEIPIFSQGLSPCSTRIVCVISSSLSFIARISLKKKDSYFFPSSLKGFHETFRHRLKYAGLCLLPLCVLMKPSGRKGASSGSARAPLLAAQGAPSAPTAFSKLSQPIFSTLHLGSSPRTDGNWNFWGIEFSSYANMTILTSGSFCVIAVSQRC